VQELEARASTQRALFDNVPVALFSMDDARNGVITQANVAFARLLGCASPEEIEGRNAAEFYPDPKERAETFARFLADPTFRATGVARFETIRRRPSDGAELPVLMSVRASFHDDGTVGRFDVAIEDLGERKRAEGTFRASEARFRIIFENAVVGVALTDPDGRIARANPAFCRFVGRTEAELYGAPLDALLADADAVGPLVGRAPAQAPETPTPAAERRFRGPHGEIAWGYAGVTWIADGEGRPFQAAVVVQDVTRKRHLEDELLRAQKLESLAVLAGGVAHDFNNFLAAVLGNLTLARRVGAAQADDYLREAEEATLRARDLTRQLLTFARGGEPVKKPVSLLALADAAARFCLRGSNVTCEVEGDASLPAVDADPGQMEEVFSNLLINAREAMPGGGRVSVVASACEVAAGSPLPLAPARYVRVVVRDEGNGIAPADLEHVFDPYFTTKQRGSGLGLATVFSIVRLHRGHVEVRSEPGRGTAFTLWIPAAHGAVVEERPPLPAASKGAGRVLVMDDEVQLRRVVSAILAEDGYEVDVAGEGGEVLARWREAADAGRPYDLAILDVTVPTGLGGAETMRRLRALDPSAKAIVTSGYATGTVLSRYREHGFAAVIEKPYAVEDLLRVVASVIRRA
jgi:PAS domain S-box-containing protein